MRDKTLSMINRLFFYSTMTLAVTVNDLAKSHNSNPSALQSNCSSMVLTHPLDG